MDIEIRNIDLTPDAVPEDVADEGFEAFALSFDGYAHWGDRCASLAEAAARAFHDHGALPSSVADMRACLFYEQQKWHWKDRPPDGASEAYLRALLDALRDAVRS
jgi:hypothetical protein